MIAGLRKVMRGESELDFIGRTKLWFTITLVILVLSGMGLGVRKLQLGVEFKGGTALTVPLTSDATIEDVEAAFEKLDLPDVDVQIQSQGAVRRVITRSNRIDPDKLGEVREALAKVAGAPSVDEVSTEDVGPSWGQQVSKKALRGLVVFIFLVSLYISVRFEPKMAAAALAALFHDLLATAGVYAWVGFQVTPATVIALLTLMGFSLYDTVVVFDRVRENAAGLSSGKQTYSTMVNESINEVLIRSINTSLTSVLPVAGLLFVGVLLFEAVTLKDLALAMFVGTLVSTYSSIFIAAPILAKLKEREPRYATLRARLGDAVVVGAPVPATVATPDASDVTSTAAPTAPRPRPRPQAAGVRQRGRKRGKPKGR